MKYGISDFFSSVIYIFVIFLPGGVMTYTLLYGIPILKDTLLVFLNNSGEMKWFILVTSSFVLGHITSLIGSIIEDQYYALIPEDKLNPKIDKDILKKAEEIVKDKLKIKSVKKKHVRHWAKLILKENKSPAYSDIERKDADRRFFRNFTVNLLLLFIIISINIICYNVKPIYLLYVTIMIILSIVRYMGQNTKYSKYIFDAIIVLDGVLKTNRK